MFNVQQRCCLKTISAVETDGNRRLFIDLNTELVLENFSTAGEDRKLDIEAEVALVVEDFLRADLVGEFDETVGELMPIIARLALYQLDLELRWGDVGHADVVQQSFVPVLLREVRLVSKTFYLVVLT